MALATDAAVGPLPAAPCAGFAIAILRCGKSIAILAAAVRFGRIVRRTGCASCCRR